MEFKGDHFPSWVLGLLLKHTGDTFENHVMLSETYPFDAFFTCTRVRVVSWKVWKNEERKEKNIPWLSRVYEGKKWPPYIPPSDPEIYFQIEKTMLSSIIFEYNKNN